MIDNSVALARSIQTAVLAVAASVVLLACQRSDTTWRGVVVVRAVPGYEELKIDKGVFATFADCERAMKVESKAGDDSSLTLQPGYVARPMVHSCVQGDSGVDIETTYHYVARKPR